jgi:hypothetical protein
MLCTVEYHNESLAISFLYISSAWSNAFVCKICGEFDGLRAWVMRGSWDVGDLGKERTAEWNDSVRHSGICTRKLPGHALVRIVHAKDIFALGITAADYVSSIIYGHIHLAALMVKHWSIARNCENYEFQLQKLWELWMKLWFAIQWHLSLVSHEKMSSWIS